MNFSIIPISMDYLTGFQEALDAVARERKFLAMVSAPPVQTVESYVRKNIENQYPHFIALLNLKVVGWCDAPPSEKEGFRHTGYLGIGVLKQLRGQGIGKALLRNTIDAAFKGPLSRIEVDVYSSNTKAIEMYKSFGFSIEGIKKKGRIIDGVAEDVLIMGLLK